jgi:hypothetical protein
LHGKVGEMAQAGLAARGEGSPLGTPYRNRPYFFMR